LTFRYTDKEDLKAFALSPIEDDPVQEDIEFELGTISFAGSGINSRTSHLFISFQQGGGQFGSNPWETPVGRVTKGLQETALQWYSGYGDHEPWGSGPQQQRLYDGVSYVEQNFPLLDRFTKCTVETTVIPSESSGTNPSEEMGESDTDSDDSEEDHAGDSEDNEGSGSNDSNDSDQDEDDGMYDEEL
jgi:hypothetical protein